MSRELKALEKRYAKLEDDFGKVCWERDRCRDALRLIVEQPDDAVKVAKEALKVKVRRRR